MPSGDQGSDRLSKKRANDEQSEMTFAEASSQFILQMGTLVGKKESLIRMMEADESLVYSALFMKASTINDKLYAYPYPELEGFKVTRYVRNRETNNISAFKSVGRTSFHDEDALRIFRIKAAALNNGCPVVMLENDRDQYSFPFVQVATEEVGTVEEEDELIRYEVYQANSVMKTFTPPKVILDFLKLDFVPVSGFNRISNLVNVACKKLSGKLSAEEFDSMDKCSEVLNDGASSQVKIDIAHALIGFASKDKTLEERVETFIKHPSIILAATLSIKEPHKADLVNVQNTKLAEKVKLKDLADDDMVVMSSITVSADTFDNTLNADEFEVFKDTKALCAAKGKKGQKKGLKAQAFDSMKALLVKKVLTAIASHNNAEGNAVKKAAETTAFSDKTKKTYFQD